MSIDKSAQNNNKKPEESPLDAVIKTILKTQSSDCVRAQVRLNELEKLDDK